MAGVPLAIAAESAAALAREGSRSLAAGARGRAAAPGATTVPAALAVGLAAVHVLSGRLRWLDGLPRSRALSLAGGVSVAYVFVHVLPEVAAAERAIAASARGPGAGGDGPLGPVLAALATLESQVYLLVLAGFVGFYGLERFVRRTRPAAPTEDAPAGVFWLHVGTFAVYNGVVGYLLFHREAPGVGSLPGFGVAMGLHFLVNDYGLRYHHREDYARVGRWVLAGGVVAGALFGAATHASEALLGALFAVLAGGVVLNVIKEELPAERESRFWAFALGAAGYATLLTAW